MRVMVLEWMVSGGSWCWSGWYEGHGGGVDDVRVMVLEWMV